MSAKGADGDVTCKILLEKKEVARNSGRIATCQSQITEDTENLGCPRVARNPFQASMNPWQWLPVP